MLSYWYDGNNCSFVLLLSLISHAALCRDIVKGSVDQSDREAVEMAEEYLKPASHFYESFANEAQTVWDQVASPFSKASKEEIRDFLADDENEEGDDTLTSHRALNMEAELEELRCEQDAAEELVARYEGLEGKCNLEDSDGDECGGGDQEDAASDDIDEGEQADYKYGGSEDDVANGGYFDESSEEEEDDWQKSILSKRVAKRKAQSPRKRSGRRVSLSETKPSPKKRAARHSPSPKSSDEELFAPPASEVRKRLAIQDSDDED